MGTTTRKTTTMKTTTTTTITTTAVVTTTAQPSNKCCSEFILKSITFKLSTNKRKYKGFKKVNGKWHRYVIKSLHHDRFFLIEQGTGVGFTSKAAQCPEHVEWQIRSPVTHYHDKYSATCSGPTTTTAMPDTTTAPQTNICDMLGIWQCLEKEVTLEQHKSHLYGLINMQTSLRQNQFALAIPVSCGRVIFDHVEDA